DPTSLDRLQLELDKQDVPITARDTLVAGQFCQLVLGGKEHLRALFVDHGISESGRSYRQLLAKLDLVSAAGYEPIRIPAWRCRGEPEVVARELAADHL
ncbi:MAG: hypothetical protein ACRD0P_24585, partial [Stackebrandtia sp.]